MVQIKFTSIIKACSIISFTDTEEQQKKPTQNFSPPTKNPIPKFG